MFKPSIQAFIVILFFLWMWPGRSIGQEESKPIEVVLRAQSNSSDTGELRGELGIKKRQQLTHLDMEIWTVELPIELEEKWLCSSNELLAYIEGHPSVDFASLDDWVQSTDTFPNDPEYPMQWGLENDGSNCPTPGQDIKAPEAWEIRTSSSKVVGILDSGIDYLNPDLRDNIWINEGELPPGKDSVFIQVNGVWQIDSSLFDGRDDDGNGYVDDILGWDFVSGDALPMDEMGHGTAVAGIIGARGNNNLGITGVCWDVKMMALRILDDKGKGRLINVLRGLEYAISKNVKITNNSWSFYRPSRILKEAVDEAEAFGVLMVCSAGNEGRDIDNPFYRVFPASYPNSNIISVGASRCDDTKASFSNFGQYNVDLFAPGHGIMSYSLGDSLKEKSGTSFAAPFVSGAAALIMSQFPDNTPFEIKQRLIVGGDQVDSLTGKSLLGSGLNLFKSISLKDYEIGIEEVFEILSFCDLDQIRDAYLDGDTMWVATWRGIFLYNTSNGFSECFTSSNSNLDNDSMFSINQGINGDVWAAGYQSLHSFQNGTWKNYDLPSEIFTIEKILKIDESDNIWLTQFGYDIGYYNPKMDTFVSLNIWDWYNNPQPIFNDFRDSPNLSIPNDSTIYTIIGQAFSNQKKLIKVNLKDSSSLAMGLYPEILTGDLGECIADKNGDTWVSIGKDSILVFRGDIILNVFNKSNSPFQKEIEIIELREEVNPFVMELTSGVILVHYYSGIDWSTDTLQQANNTYYTNLLLDTKNNFWLIDPLEDRILKYGYEADDWMVSAQITEGGDIPFKSAYGLEVDLKGRVWFQHNQESPGWGSSPFVYNGREWYQYLAKNTQDSLASYVISNDQVLAFADSLVIIGFGSYGGVFVFENDQLIDHFRRSDTAFRGTSIQSIEVGSEKVWIRSDSALMFFPYKDSLVLENVSVPSNINLSRAVEPDLVDKNLHSLAMENDSLLWLVGMNEFIKYLPKEEKWLSYKADSVLSRFLPLNDSITKVESVYASDSSLIWFSIVSDSLKHSIAIYRPLMDTWELIPQVELGYSLNDSIGRINSYSVDNDGRTWLGNSISLLRYDGLNWLKFDSTNSSITKIADMSIDFDNNIWITSGEDFVGIFQPEFVASFSTPTSILCLNDTATFTNTGYLGDSLAWEINGVIVSKDTNLMYSFSKIGLSEVRLKVFDGDSIISAFQNITVRPPIDVDLGPDTTLCAEGLYLRSDNIQWRHSWYNGIGDTLSTKENLLVDTTAVYFLTAQDECGSTDTDSIRVKFMAPPKDSTCVWPGDGNGDGWVNMLDYLMLGKLNGIVVGPRPAADINFSSQVAPLSNMLNSHPYGNGKDLVHLDFDGDGIIDILFDKKVVRRNAQGAIPTFVQAADTGSYRLRIVPEKDEIFVGDTIVYNILLDDENGNPIEDAYSLRVGLEFNSNIGINSKLDFTGSAWGEEGVDVDGLIIPYGNGIDLGITQLNSRIPKGRRPTRLLASSKSRGQDTTKYHKKEYLTMNPFGAILLDSGAQELALNTLSASTIETVVVRYNRVEIGLKIFLEGAYNPETGLMRTDLRAQDLIPKSHPYGDLYQPNYDVLPTNLVDWVLVELRDKEDSMRVISQRAGWVLSNGEIIDPEGGPISLLAKDDHYFIVIRHRNHFPVMIMDPIYLKSDSLINLDFTSSNNLSYNISNQVELADGNLGLHVGDANQNGLIVYSGESSDLNSLILDSGFFTKYGVGYFNGDLDLDGVVDFIGKESDRLILLNKVGRDTPKKILICEVPK